VARHKIETTGKAKRLVATPELLPDQKYEEGSLIHVRIHAVDAKGRRVFSAQDNLQFSVEGDARIVAVTNGDITSNELNATDHIHLWNGSAMVILRVGKNPGKLTLTTTSPAFKTVKTKLLK